MNNSNKIEFYKFNHKDNGGNKNKEYVLLSCLAIIFIFISVYLLYLSSKPLVIDKLSYKTNGIVNYTTYYGEDKVDYNTYVRNYLTSIDINFNHSSKFSKKMIGKSLYSVEAHWFAYNTGYKNEKIYISDTETLVPLSEKKVINQDEINNSVTTKVDYKKYLQSYLSYKSSSKVSSQALLVVEYKVINEVKTKGMENINNDDIIKLEIPLSENTFKISSKSTTTGRYKTINKLDKNSKYNKIKFTLGIIFALLSIIDLVILILIYIKESKNESKYTKELKKILNSYDNIIVDTEKLPDITNKNIVNVKNFDELLDAQMQIGMPINFQEEENRAIFILIKNDMAWVYIINKY